MKTNTIFSRRWLLTGAVLFLGTVFLSSDTAGFPANANRYFSPNLDGVKDVLPIPLSI
ncbi:MAG: hypothetical protein JNM63_12380, partial [Spirochaetia bacterium]|nr:hypothetical protein [Spirochaetia bacterium]